MPIYEYVCQKCGRKTEVIQGHSAPPPKSCPHCGGAMKKAFSAPAIQFKGSGFYLTDYGKGDAGPKKDGETTDRTEKSGEKAEKAEKSAKAEKGEKAERSEKPDKPEKKESAAPSGVSAAKSAEKKKKAES